MPPPGVPPPPPKKGPAWWVWLLAGCGGCAVLVLIAGVIFTVWFGNTIGSVLKDTGPITAEQARRNLGPEVPIYPGSTYDENSTRGGTIGLKIVEKAGAKDLFRGIGAYRTEDPPERVWAFYEEELGRAGWTKPPGGSQVNQRIYQKGKDTILVQIQDQPGGRVILLMRGGPGLAKLEGR